MSEVNQPLYQKIYNFLIDGIESGKYKNGDRLPSEKELAEEFEVSRITSKKALGMLAEDGYIKRMPGRGSFVARSNKQDVCEKVNADGTKSFNSLIGFVISDFSESYGTGLISGIEREASNNGCFIIPRRSLGCQDLEVKAIESLIDVGVDGIIIMPVHGEHYNPRILKLILEGFSVVFLDRHLRGIAAPFVGTDNIAAAKKATDYLLGLGHRNISFISSPSVDTSTIEDRIEGFVKSHAEHGVVIDESIWITSLISTMPDNNNRDNILTDMDKIKQLIKNNPHITCLFATEYNVALIALEALKSLGKSVPEDISILCFDGPSNYTGEYFFTHVRQRETEMGATAFELLQKQIKDRDGTEKIFLDADLIIGHSTKEIRNDVD